MSLPRGAWPVMLTPMTESLDVDFDVLDRYTDWLIANGAAGLFPVALSGEMYELNESERLDVARRVVARAAGRVPVVAAVVEYGDASAVAEAVRRMASTGVDAVVLIASVLLAVGEDEGVLREKVRHVVDTVPDVPLGIYECPQPHHVVLSTATVAWLGSLGRFVFYKDTSHDPARMAQRLDAVRGTGFTVFDAGIETLVQSLAVGTSGLSGWVVNAYPDEVQWIVEHASTDPQRARAVQDALDEVERTMGPTYPNSAKALVELRAGIGFLPVSRWQHRDVDPELVARLHRTATSARTETTSV